jgi:uroporphyrinogen-III synthase
MTMRILVTRPREDAERLARSLESRGHDVLIEPLFTIEPDLQVPIDLDGVQALLMTSANGVRAFALRSSRRDLRVFAVGDATAEAAREFGFADVESAGGDVTDLAQLVRSRVRPEQGALLHAAGSAVAGNLAGELGAAGIEVRRVVLYRAAAASSLSDAAVAALHDGRVDLAMFFSPRTARTFVSLAKAAGVDQACAHIALLGLSPAVADAAADIPWAAREVAEEPNEAALLAAVDRLAALHEGGTQEKMSEPTRPEEQPMQPPETAPAATMTAPPPVPRGSMTPVALAIILALAALGWSAWREFAPRADAGAERLARLEQRAATFERDVSARLAPIDHVRADSERRSAALAERIGAVETRLDALVETMKGLDSRFEQLAQQPKNEADMARLAALTAENRRQGQELARLQEELAGLNATLGERGEQRRSESLVLALGQLREALERGAPYAPALATARSLAADDQAVMPLLAPLDAGADRGVPTRADLRARFDKVAAEAARRDTVAAADGWWGPLAERLSSLISVRRVGEVDGDTNAALLARAEQRLEADDLAGAVAEVEKLQGAAAAPAQAWLADARARLQADAAFARLSAYALRSGSPSQ